jgi:Spy/CpxP family protein refolding chaperone
MMSKKFLIIVLAISVTINLVAVFTLGYYWWEIRSHERGMMPHWMGRGHDWHESPLRHKLNLTEEQIEALNKNQEEMRTKMLPYREELFEKRKALMELLRDTEPNKALADSLFKEIVNLQIELEARVFDNLWYVRSILTPEQRGILEALIHGLFEEHRPPEPPLHHMPPPPNGGMP